MPLFQRLEQEHGSVIKGLRAMGTEKEAQGARYNLFFSLKGGFGAVVNALEEQLPEGSLKTASRVDSVEPLAGQGAWKLNIRGQGEQSFDALVLALPAPSAAKLLMPFAPEIGESLADIPCRGAVTVNLSYDRESYLNFVPRAYGFVVPSQERRPLLACTFSSRKWPHRGSEERGILRTYFGGPGMEWALKASDEELVEVSISELSQLLQYHEDPLDYSVHRWPIGLPEYRVGHRQRVQSIREALENFPSLSVVGNFLDGVGLPDCVRLGRRAVSKLVLV